MDKMYYGDAVAILGINPEVTQRLEKYLFSPNSTTTHVRLSKVLEELETEVEVLEEELTLYKSELEVARENYAEWVDNVYENLRKDVLGNEYEKK